ncbi:hypothetical protein BSL78_04282 [Apostichopus japonicus]|uniref:Uncharacterized protein n=1 Tax=Stichopus japonicus TaxID=307972 RepID=A0A2G8LF02_STIJA|nr:hypothetical protein BSL78_04282 [Apostichopus japonicus]
MFTAPNYYYRLALGLNFLTISRERITKVLTMHVCKRLVLIWLLMVLYDARVIGRTRMKDGSNNRQNSHEGNPRRCNRLDQQAVCDTPASRYCEQDSFLAMITNEAICDHFEASVTHKKIHFHPSVDGCSKALKWLEEAFDPSSTSYMLYEES